MKSTPNSALRQPLLRVARVHYLYIIALTAQLIAYDAAKLFPLDVVLKRWLIIVALAIATTAVWYSAKGLKATDKLYSKLTWVLIVTDVAAASYNVYLQRGMASRAVLLFVIPIITAAILAKRSALLTATALSVAAYVAATISYFNIHFNEGYKIELYGEVGFYSAMLFIVSNILWSLLKKR